MNEKPGYRKVRLAAAVYYLLQGVAVAAWWAAMKIWPSIVPHFAFDDAGVLLNSFFLPDMLLIVPISLVVALLLFCRVELFRFGVWLLSGIMAYATFHTCSFVFATNRGMLGAIMMIGALIWTGVFAVGLTFDKLMFSRSKSSSTDRILLKTFAQIVVVWTAILVVIPYLLFLAERQIGIPQLVFPFQLIVAGILFAAASVCGISAAVVMSTVGRGTPLPLDHANELVVSGVYRYVRNPMALSGIAQGVIVALFWGSPLVFAYAITGSLIWQLIFRPLEEDDLEERFGQKFIAYRDSVRCWIPSLKPFGSK